MYDDATVLRLLDHVYDAPLDPQAWCRFIDQLADTINGHHVAFSFLDADAGSATYLATARSDPAFREEYHRQFSGSDPWVLAAKARGLLKPGFVELGEHVLPSSIYRNTAFYNELGRRYGFLGGIAALFGGASILGGISASQVRAGDFGKPELQLFRALQPHLHRSFVLSRRLNASNSYCNSLLEVLDKLSTAAILVDHAGIPLLMNSAALRIVNRRDGISNGRGGLSANTTAETDALQKLLSRTALPASAAGAAAGGALRLSRRSMKQPLHVAVSRLRGSTRHRMDERAKAIVFLHDPDSHQEISCERLATLHCLTHAEARIGAMLASGGSVQSMSEQLHVSSHTVRTHIKHLLAKTDTTNQAQLVRLFVRSLASISDTAES